MTINTFWTIFLKIFTLYLIWQTLTVLPSFFSTLIYAATQDPDKASLLIALSAIIFIVCLFLLVVRNCLFKTDWVIKKLSLDKGFTDENIEINIHRGSLLSIAIIVLGGLMLADALPLLVYDAFNYVQHDDTYTGFSKNRASPYLVSNLLKIIIGYFMVVDSRLIVNFIERKRRKATTNVDDAIE